MVMKPGIIETKSNRLPKAELHVHLRNSMSTQLTERLATKNNIEYPLERINGNEFVWTDFADMLKIHDVFRPIFRTRRDYMMIAENYLTWCAGKGLIYCELMISYSPDQTGGISYQDQINGIAEGIDRAREDTGIEGRIILSGIRHRPLEKTLLMVKEAQKYPHPYVTGFGLAGDEVNHGPEKFKDAFQIAVDAGLKCTVHAGEWRGPDSIRHALDLPGVTRLGHGFRALDDDALIKDMVARNITLELCPSSSVRLKLFKDYKDYPFRKLIDKGLKVTLNTDDPPYFSTSISREYRRIAEAHKCTVDEMLDITRNALNAAFIDVETRKRLMKKVDGWKLQ